MGYAVIVLDDGNRGADSRLAETLPDAMRRYDRAVAAMAARGQRRVVLVDRASGLILADSKAG